MLGDEMRGIERAEAGGRVLLTGLRAGSGPASNVVLAPRASRRELLAGARTLVELTVLPERTDGLVVQWVPGPGPASPLEIGFRTPPGTTARPPHGDTLVAEGGDGDVLLYRLVPAPSRWTVEGDAAVRALVDAPPGSAVTLLAARGASADDAGAALSAAARTRVHEARSDRAVATVRRERLALHTGVPELDEALEWAKVRLDGAAPSEPPDHGDLSPLRAPLVCLGRAAAGDHEGARRIAAELPREGAPSLLAVGWTTAWTGSVAGWTADEIEAAARALLAGEAPLAGDAGAPALRRLVERAAVSVAADALAGLAGPAGRRRAEALEAAAAEERPPPGWAGGVRLPVVGGGRRPVDAADTALPALPALLAPILGRADSPSALPAPTGPGPLRALRAWACFATGHPDDGYATLREHLGEAFRGPRGCWSGPGGGVDDPVATALVPTVLLHGLLGARPDAPFGRLRLAPALPASWTSFRVTGVRLGGAVLELACRAGKGRHTFVLRPTAGAVPATIVFEPSVAGSVSSVRVDGEPSDVEAVRVGGRTRVALQLPLDRERSVSLDA